MTGDLRDICAYLATTPLLGLTVTLVAYQLCHRLYARSGFHPLLNPVALAVALVVFLLWATGTAYETYFEGAQFVHFLLGPATVALAIPLHAQFAKVRRNALPIAVALVGGSLVACVSAVGIAWALGASRETLVALAPKSVTAPIAMGIAEQLGGSPSLTAVLVVTTGVLGAVCGKYVLDAVGVREHAFRGFAIGVASHGIGTARAFQLSEEAGAFAGLAMGLNGLLTAVLVPLLAWAVLRF